MKELLKATPDDAELMHTIDKTERELQHIHDEQEAKDKLGLNKGPLEGAAEFLALSAEEIGQFRKVFHKLDKDHDGQVNQSEFCKFIGVKNTPFVERLFVLMDEDNDGEFGFGELLQAVGTFCMFGHGEMLRFAFGVFDKDGNGKIEDDELKALLKMLHGQNYDVVCKHTLDRFDTDRDGFISFPEFQEMDRNFPNLMFPCFQVQEFMMKKFYGSAWWRRRKNLFHEARIHIAGNVAVQADKELNKKLNGGFG